MKSLSALFVATALALAVGCGPASAPDGKNEPKPAPDLVLESVRGGSTFSLREQEGKVVLVDLWATWCAPCLAELPHLQKLADTHDPDDFLMVGIVLESGSVEEIREFLDEKNVEYLNVIGPEGTKEAFGPFLGYPTKYLIDQNNHVVKRYFGMAGDQLFDDVERLLRTGSLEASGDGAALTPFTKGGYHLKLVESPRGGLLSQDPVV